MMFLYGRQVAPLLLAVSLLVQSSSAAEVTTNGTGGGNWSLGTTWRGGKSPVAGDDVVVRKFDIVTFDRDDAETSSCARLQVDPKGVLQFKTNQGKVTLVASDEVEIFGALKLDGTKSDRDSLELRLTGATPEKRRLRVAKGGSLLLYGKPGLADGKKNVTLHAVSPENDAKNSSAEVLVEGPAAIDWQRASLRNVRLTVKQIDNTGARTNERCQLIDNRWEGMPRIALHNCDSVVITRNELSYAGETVLQEAAIWTFDSPLTEVKQNTVRGKYLQGIQIGRSTDPTLIGNLVEGSTIGIDCGGGVPNAMLRQNTMRQVEIGLRTEGTSGVVEQTRIECLVTAVKISNSNVQFTTADLQRLPDAKGPKLELTGGVVTLLNVNLTPQECQITPYATANERPTQIVSQQFVVVAAPQAAANSLVEIRTTEPAPKPGAADLNVRNSPAVIANGLSPLADKLTAVVVKTWVLEANGILTPPPQYEVKLLGPAKSETETRPVLKTESYRPTADAGYRAKVDDPTPTLEIKP